MIPRIIRVFGCLMMLSMLTEHAGAGRGDLMLETETAELGKKGDQLISSAMQFEREEDGSHTGLTLNHFEVGITDRAELLIEPFFYEWQRPKGGDNTIGLGDLEIAPSYIVALKQPLLPAVVLALKIKVPTATNREIGTAEVGYYPYVILGKNIQNWTFNADFGYNLLKSPHDESLHSQYIYDFSAGRHISKDCSVFVEMFGNSSPAAGEDSTVAGAFATEYHFSKNVNAFVSVGYDTGQLLVVRPGFNIEF